MFEPTDSQPAHNADEWANRSEFWMGESARSARKRRVRERNQNPLILTGHGSNLRVEDGTLVVRDGFTHYPQQQVSHRFFPGSREIPQRILLLDGSGTLSFDVLSWLGEQGVALARVCWTGKVACVASGTGYASDHTKVEWQHRTRADEPARIKFAAGLIRAKLLSSIETLETFLTASARRDATIERHQQGAARLQSERFVEMNDIRAIEGQCASMYFTAWQSLEVRWKGAKAIPDDWRTFVCRSSLANGVKPYNREASHPINAMLNYAYAVKLAHMQIAAIAEGYDPTIGIMHHARRGKPAFIFDRIEPERPRVDALILDLVQRHAFSAADFALRKDGVCRLSPQLARMVATLVAP